MAGFELSSARGGANIWKVLESAGFTGETAMRDFRAEMTKRGIPNDIGQKNSKALTELNKMAKIKYTPLTDELLKLEKEIGLDKSGKFSLSKKLDDVQKWAHKTFGKKTTMAKMEGIIKKLEDIPQIAKKGAGYLTKLGFKMLMPVGAAYSLLESKPLASGELTPEGIEEYKKGSMQQTMNRRGGGMMDIDTMTQPLGYYRGGVPVDPELDEGFKPRNIGYAEAVANINNPEYIHKWNMTKPRQPGLDEKLMQDYEPPIPRWGKAKDFIGELFGGRGAEGSEIPLKMELKMLIDQLRLAKGMEGSVLMPSSNQDQIKRLENRIQEIKIELYKSGQ